MADELRPESKETDALQQLEVAVCLRCRLQKPVDDDGFCESCAKAMEQACL